ncbi:hypothetical protein [Nitrosomonas sp. wSCUT-2]
MEAFIQKLRRRAAIQKYLAFLALAGAVVIVWIGTDYFIHESPKIAAQDIEQQRKLIPSQDIIARLASLSMSIFNNAKQLDDAENELYRIQNIVSYDGNYNLGDIQSTYYFNFTEPRNLFFSRTYGPFGPLTQKKLSNYDWELGGLTKKKLNEIDSLLNDIRNANTLLGSESAIDKYHTDLQILQDRNKKRLEELIHRTDKFKKDLEYMRNTMKQIGEPNIDANLKNTFLLNDFEEIRDLEQVIKEFDKKMNSGEFQREAEEHIKTMLQTNRAVIEQIEAFKIKVISNRDLYQEKLRKQEELVNKLRTEKANLEAEKEFIVSLRSGDEPVMADSKVAFHVSTNIARLGIMIVTLFLAQVFISIYRYLTKISNFYHARADALEILTTDTLKNTDLPGSIEMFSNIFSPEKVDFGKIPQAPLNEAIKSAQSVFPKS